MKVHFENFRCFRRADIEFGPLTLILGENAAGKTSILRALDPGIVLGERDVWRREPDRSARIEVTGAPHGPYEVSWIPRHGCMLKSQRYPGRMFHAHERATLSELGFGYQFLDLSPKHLRFPGNLGKTLRLDGSGGNLINVFDSLTRAQKIEVAEEFCKLVPVFGDVDREPVAGTQQQELRFRDAFNEMVWYTPEEVSDGSILTLAYLLLPYQQPPVDILVIEEPERALHPYLVERVITLLRQLAEGKLGRGHMMRIVLTTHSPSTVDFCRPEEVRILSRLEDGSVEIRKLPIDTPDWREGFEIYGRSLGAVWLSGGVGGVPGS